VINVHVETSTKVSFYHHLVVYKVGALQWRCQPKIFSGAKYFDFKRATVFCLGHRLSKHKMTYAKNLGGRGPIGPPSYIYGVSY